MAKVTKRTFSLSEEQAAYIDKKVASGGYVSGSEVVREGLRTMQEHDAALDRWIREEVVPTLEKYEADPSRARPIDEVFDELMAEFQAEDAQPRARKAAVRRSA